MRCRESAPGNSALLRFIHSRLFIRDFPATDGAKTKEKVLRLEYEFTGAGNLYDLVYLVEPTRDGPMAAGATVRMYQQQQQQRNQMIISQCNRDRIIGRGRAKG